MSPTKALPKEPPASGDLPQETPGEDEEAAAANLNPLADAARQSAEGEGHHDCPVHEGQGHSSGGWWQERAAALNLQWRQPAYPRRQLFVLVFFFCRAPCNSQRRQLLVVGFFLGPLSAFFSFF